MAFAVEGLFKSYGAAAVLRGVDLAVEDGEIHALLGANGAGKSTLIKCLSGAETPDAGRIRIGDATFPSLNPREAREVGVAVVYQELSLALSLTAADNIFLGREKRIGPFVRKSAQRRIAVDLLQDLGVQIDVDSDLGSVGNAELQSIEIVKALASNPKVLILDEPTAALSEREANRLADRLKQLKKLKLPVLYVTHRLSEVFALADRVTILRGGSAVLSGRVADLTHEEIVAAIVGRSVDRLRPDDRNLSSDGNGPLMAVRDLVANGIGPISFDVRPGEVLGVFGLVGSGRTELLESLFGARDVLGGTIDLGNGGVRPKSPSEAFSCGLALVPSDRLRKSMFPSLTAADNLLASSFKDVAQGWVRRRAREQSLFGDAAANLNLQPRRPDLEARRFSGGNQQKLVLGRWLNSAKDCRVLLLDEPTQGVDVGARSEIYAALRAAVAAGDRAVVATSSEPEELMQIADRVIVLSHGRLVGVLDSRDITEKRLLALAHAVEDEGKLLS